MLVGLAACFCEQLKDTETAHTWLEKALPFDLSICVHSVAQNRAMAKVVGMPCKLFHEVVYTARLRCSRDRLVRLVNLAINVKEHDQHLAKLWTGCNSTIAVSHSENRSIDLPHDVPIVVPILVGSL